MDGEIVVAGQAVTSMDHDDRARFRRCHIGMVFQFFNLIDDLNALENVLLPAMIAGSSRSQAERRATEALDLLGLAAPSTTAIRHLSGGQRQRVALARRS